MLSFLSCRKNDANVNIGGPELAQQAHLKANGTSATINPGMTMAQINATIASVSAGDTVFVEPGTYTIDSVIAFKPGVALVKKTALNPIFDATGTGNQLFEMSYYAAFKNVTVKGITFWNIRIRIGSVPNVKFTYCTFDYGKRKPGTDKTYLTDAYLQFVDTDSSTVDSCKFFRRSGNSGRAIYSINTTNLRIINNQIGDGGSLGYFVTSINGSTNTNSNTQIQANHIERNPSWVNDNETDHGIYLQSFDGVLIKYNTISGWPANGSGGAVKARNGQHITIFGNHMNNSGVLLYEYDLPAFPYLKYVDVSYNTINITTNVNDGYHGISYYRDNTSGLEYSIRITHNTMSNGTIWANGSNLNVTNFNASSGGVYDNDYGILTIKSGINNSGNF